MKKITKNDAIKGAAFVAVAGITGIVAWAAIRAIQSVKQIGEVDFDFGNDEGLSQMFRRRDE